MGPGHSQDLQGDSVIRTHSTAAWVAFAGFLAVASACATGRGVGVHPDYRKQAIESVAIWPFYTAGSFQLDEPSRRHLLDAAQKSAATWLKERLPDVTSAEVLTARLQADDASDSQTGGSNGAESEQDDESSNAIDELDVELVRRFNPSERHRPSQAADRLMQWHKQNRLPERYVLLGRVVYHTETTCRVRATDFNERAAIDVHEDLEPALPNPCIVTHLRLKLVDASRGATVWYNEGLREYHVPDLTRERIARNVDRLVARLLGGDDGLDDLIK